jgi:hypothetical protein
MAALPVRHLRHRRHRRGNLPGSERNKRRGFHNLFVFGQRLQRQLAQLTA